MPLLRLFLDICLYRKGPQDCPASDFLLGLTIAANFIISSLVILSMTDTGILEAAGQAVLGLTILALFVTGALYITSKKERIGQTLTSAFACDSLISLLAASIVFAAGVLPIGGAFINLTLLALMIWQVAVLSHIMKNALSIPLLAAFTLTIIYFMASYRIILSVFPETA